VYPKYSRFALLLTGFSEHVVCSNLRIAKPVSKKLCFGVFFTNVGAKNSGVSYKEMSAGLLIYS